MRIEVEPHEDVRGSFARLYCPKEFADAGIDFLPSQVNLSTNLKRHTLRGMHFQKPPFAEAKLVRVVRGRVWDVVIDLRSGPDQGRWIAEELTATRMNALFLPEGVAHGFLTLEPDTEVLYQMGRPYEPGHSDGVRWDDPSFGIDWPDAPEKVVSDQDKAWPDFEMRTDLKEGF
jgi:dTDP-4-dehydrorhamnose 3,5-epimerase